MKKVFCRGYEIHGTEKQCGPRILASTSYDEELLSAGTEVFTDLVITQVFYNLMDNAVRYGGKITAIRFSAPESGDNPLVVCEDDGDGVASGEKEKIFERGFRKNTGLGLFLSREILSITGIMNQGNRRARKRVHGL